MQLVYTHPNPLIVGNVKNILEQAGIEAVTLNQFAAGGVGELAPINAWPELWVVKEGDAPRAQELVQRIEHGEKSDWICSHCGEKNPGGFECCWSCECDATA